MVFPELQKGDRFWFFSKGILGYTDWIKQIKQRVVLKEVKPFEHLKVFGLPTRTVSNWIQPVWFQRGEALRKENRIIHFMCPLCV